MNPRSIILIVAALLVAGGTAFMARGLLTAPAPTPAAQVQQDTPSKKVLVAKANLPAGTFIKEEDVTWQKWPTDGVNSAYLVDGQNELSTVVGAVVRKGIVAGQPITEAQIARPGDRGFLAAVLTPGMRAVTIGVGDTTSVAGLVFPGDRIDLLLLQRMPKLKGEEANEGDTGTYNPLTAETFLENVRILATDRRMNDLESEPKSLDTVTIEVTPKQAEMLAAVKELGTLSLSLRGLAKPEKGNTASVASASGGTMPATKVAFVKDVAAATPTTGTDDAAGVETEEPPVRGESFTYDLEVSRTLADRVNPNETTAITVIRGAPSGEVRTEVIHAD